MNSTNLTTVVNVEYTTALKNHVEKYSQEMVKNVYTTQLN